MPDTMKPSDVLYKVALKTRDSVKWSEIKRINRGKAVPAEVVSKVGEILGEKGHKKLDLKVGTIGKLGKRKLVLRVKNDSKHLYDYVLEKNFNAPTAEELQAYNRGQEEAFHRADEEIADKFRITLDATQRFGTAKVAYDAALAQAVGASKALATGGLGPEEIQVHLQTLNRAQAALRSALDEIAHIQADHAGALASFRSSGAKGLATRYGVDDDRGRALGRRFVEHARGYAAFEGKCISMRNKGAEALLSIHTDMRLYADGADVVQVTLDMLSETRVNVSRLIKDRLISMKPTEPEKWLASTINSNDVVSFEAMLSTGETRLETTAKSVDRIKKLMSARFSRIPAAARNVDAVVELTIAIQQEFADFEAQVREYFELTRRALAHIADLLEQIRAADAT